VRTIVLILFLSSATHAIFYLLDHTRCKLPLFAIQATEYGLLAILMALISNSADDFQFNDHAVQQMRICLPDSNSLDGLLGRGNGPHPKGSAVLQVCSFQYFTFVANK
jgi:hypothetical protein